MNFIVTERKDDKDAYAHLDDSTKIDAAALPGAYDE